MSPSSQSGEFHAFVAVGSAVSGGGAGKRRLRCFTPASRPIIAAG